MDNKDNNNNHSKIIQYQSNNAENQQQYQQPLISVPEHKKIHKQPIRHYNTPYITNPVIAFPKYHQPSNKLKKDNKLSGLKGIGRFFIKRKKNEKDKNKNTDKTKRNSPMTPPKRVPQKFDDEKYCLYHWLKPIKTLGEGAYAKVIEVQDIRTKKTYALKKNRHAFNNVADARRILREIKLMIHMDHQNMFSHFCLLFILFKL